MVPAGSRTQPLLEPSPSSPTSAVLESEVHVGLDIAGLSGRKPVIVALVVALAYLCSGVVAFHLLLNLTWPSAFYFAVTTSLTVGYGDIDAWTAMDNSSSANDGVDYEPTDGAIIFTTLYIVGGMIVMGTSLGLILQSLLEGPSKQGADSEPNFAQRNPLLVSSSLCIVTICGGAAFIVATEEDADFVHGLYWAVVTMSTVGYGSATPQTDGATLTLTLILTLALSRYGSGTPETDGGRLFAAFYMLFGQG